MSSSSKPKVVTEPTTTTSSQPSTAATRKKTGSIFANHKREASGSVTTPTISQQTTTTQTDGSSNSITPPLNLAQAKQSQTKDETASTSQSTTPRQLPLTPLTHTRSRSSSRPLPTVPTVTTSQSAPASSVTSPSEQLSESNPSSTQQLPSQKMNKIYSNPFFLMDRNNSTSSPSSPKPTSISNSPKRNSIETTKSTTTNSKRNSLEPTISAFSNASQATTEAFLAMKKKRKSLATIGSPTPGSDSPIKSHGELNLETLQEAIQKELMLQEQLLQNATMNSPVPQVSSLHVKSNSNGGSTSNFNSSVMSIPEFEIPLIECEIPALGNYNSHLRYQSSAFFSCMHFNLQQQQANNSSVQLLQIEPTDELFLTNMPLQLRPFWVMKMLRTTFTFGKGGFIMSEEIFCPQEIWMQDDLRLDGVYGKTKFCQRICDELHSLHVKIRDLDLQKDCKFIVNEWKEFLKRAKQHYKKLKKHLPLKSKKYSLDDEAQLFTNSPVPSSTSTTVNSMALEPSSNGGAINIEEFSTISSSSSASSTSSSSVNQSDSSNRIQSPKPKPMERNRSTSKFIDFGKQIYKSAKRTVRSGLGLTEKASNKHPYIPTLLNVFDKSQVFVPWFEFYYCLQNTQQDKELQSGIEAIVTYFQRILTKFILHDWNQMVDRYMKKTRESFSRLFPENAKM